MQAANRVMEAQLSTVIKDNNCVAKPSNIQQLILTSSDEHYYISV